MAFLKILESAETREQHQLERFVVSKPSQMNHSDWNNILQVWTFGKRVQYSRLVVFSKFFHWIDFSSCVQLWLEKDDSLLPLHWWCVHDIVEVTILRTVPPSWIAIKLIGFLIFKFLRLPNEIKFCVLSQICFYSFQCPRRQKRKNAKRKKKWIHFKIK